MFYFAPRGLATLPPLLFYGSRGEPKSNPKRIKKTAKIAPKQECKKEPPVCEKSSNNDPKTGQEKSQDPPGDVFYRLYPKKGASRNHH